jgi:type I restriction enzyme S subunit
MGTTNGFATERLGDLCDVVRGSSPRPKGDPRYFGGSIPWVLISDVTRAPGRFLTTTRETVTAAGRQLSRYVERGKLIVSNSATVGFPIFMGVSACIHDGFLTFLNVNPRLSLEWLYWYFLFARNHLEHLAPEGTQKNLNTEIVENIKIPVPPLPEQERVTSLLRMADRLRRTRRYARQLSNTFLQSVFLEMFGASFQQDDSKTRFGDLVKITGGGTPSRDIAAYFTGTIPWLTSKDMRGDYIFDTQEHITEAAVANSATHVVPADSILVVVKSKVLMHRLPVAISVVPLCHGQDIKSIQCCNELLPEFARYLLRYYERHLLNLARGANTEGLTLPMLNELLVPDVSLQLQQEFADVVRRFERLRAQQREAERQVEHLFQTLLHRAFVP